MRNAHDINRTHARGMDNKDFWGVYHEHLEMVAGLAGKGCPLSHHIVMSYKGIVSKVDLPLCVS